MMSLLPNKQHCLRQNNSTPPQNENTVPQTKTMLDKSMQYCIQTNVVNKPITQKHCCRSQKDEGSTQTRTQRIHRTLSLKKTMPKQKVPNFHCDCHDQGWNEVRSISLGQKITLLPWRRHHQINDTASAKTITHHPQIEIPSPKQRHCWTSDATQSWEKCRWQTRHPKTLLPQPKWWWLHPNKDAMQNTRLFHQKTMMPKQNVANIHHNHCCQEWNEARSISLSKFLALLLAQSPALMHEKSSNTHILLKKLRVISKFGHKRFLDH